jgi:predicted ATPase
MAGSPVPLSSFATFGELLRFLRRRAQLSQRDLSVAVGYSESQISRIENNQRPPDKASLLALFVPALQTEDEPALVARLLELAEAGRAAPSSEPAMRSVPAPSPAHPAPAAPPTGLTGSTANLTGQAGMRNHLPGQLTSFIGREEELAELCDLLHFAGTRLVTLIGAGGCGKTRLALRIGEKLAQEYEHGAWLVEFASLADPQLAPNAVAAAFNLNERTDQPFLSVLADFLRPRQALLILDNCEHLVEAVAHLVGALLRACPRLQILATSRETLGVPGEIVYSVQPLALPPAQPGVQPSRTAVEGYDAIQLFVERAHTALRTFTLTDENAPAIVRICRRLDGLPLGIELAAAWMNLLNPEQIAGRLERDFNFLMSGSRTVLPRHQTLRAAIEWSYHLLSAAERLLLRRLAVFEGGWMLDAAEAVTTGAASGNASFAKDQVLSLLRQLVNKSLVTVNWSAEGAARYRLLEPIREYLWEKLIEAKEEEQIRNRHLEFFVHLAETAEPALKSDRQLAWLDRLDQEQDNLRAALTWSMSQKKAEEGLRLAGALGHYWEMRFELGEGGRWCEAVLVMANEDTDLQGSLRRAKALFASGMLACYRFDLEFAHRRLEESFALYQALGDPAGGGAALCFLANAQADLHKPDQALCTSREGLQLCQRAEDAWWIAETLH